ncbi:MAG: Fatty acid-binding protein [Actinobacteria bacterium]|nr:Fatty acid-binding protein [Actinomycetota bacterium]
MGILFLVETLQYLKMGGRIGGAKGLLASMLKIQPILTIKEGQVDAFKNVRGWNKARQVMLDTMGETLKADGQAVIFVGHSDSLQEAEELAERCREKFAPRELNIWEIGSVVGTHAGPGTLAAVYFNEFRQDG